mmetsp:Transcript_100834/g.284411  ORF Transcript_100834/g.284411 Transcript_100834/m.284411 type:complete len:298 (-) Transcript_100834:3-896(-)
MPLAKVLVCCAAFGELPGLRTQRFCLGGKPIPALLGLEAPFPIVFEELPDPLEVAGHGLHGLALLAQLPLGNKQLASYLGFCLLFLDEEVLGERTLGGARALKPWRLIVLRWRDDRRHGRLFASDGCTLLLRWSQLHRWIQNVARTAHQWIGRTPSQCVTELQAKLHAWRSVGPCGLFELFRQGHNVGLGQHLPLSLGEFNVVHIRAVCARILYLWGSIDSAPSAVQQAMLATHGDVSAHDVIRRSPADARCAFRWQLDRRIARRMEWDEAPRHRRRAPPHCAGVALHGGRPIWGQA